jgi:hypothetical protein
MGARVEDDNESARATYALVDEVARLNNLLEVAMPELTRLLARVVEVLDGRTRQS